MELLVLLEELQVGTTADQRVLGLDLILDDKSLALVVDLLGELGGDGVVGGRVLDDQTLIALNTLEDGGLLDSPLANVGPVLLGLRVVLLGVGPLPSRLPALGELLQEGGLQGRWLKERLGIATGELRRRSTYGERGPVNGSGIGGSFGLLGLGVAAHEGGRRDQSRKGSIETHGDKQQKGGRETPKERDTLRKRGDTKVIYKRQWKKVQVASSTHPIGISPAADFPLRSRSIQQSEDVV